MIILVMALLGSGLGLAAATLELRLMTSALRRTPGAIPAPQTVLAIAILYLGWATIRLTGTWEPPLDPEWVTFASLLYALLQVDVGLQILRMMGGPFAVRVQRFAIAFARPAVRAFVAAALLVLVIATWLVRGELTGTLVWRTALTAGATALVLQVLSVRWPAEAHADRAGGRDRGSV
jgi:hypothetical protein